MIKFVELYHAQEGNDKEKYFQEVVECLSKEKKSLPTKYNYDKEGSEIYSKLNFTDFYYLSNSEKEIFAEQSSDILSTIGKEKFNLIELGAGDGLKTRLLIEQAVKEEYEFEYIPIDISHASNLQLAENIKKVSDKVDMTILTADYEDGVKWILENKKGRNVFSILSSNLGNFTDEGIKEFMLWLKVYLRKGDMLIVGLDMKKDPFLIQQAYSNAQGTNSRFGMNNLSRINRQLDGNLDLNNFYPHFYYDPQIGCVKACVLSACNQTIKIRQKQFTFKEYEVIHLGKSRKFAQSQVEEMIFKVLDVKLVKYFDDKRSFFRENICIKQ